MVGMSPNAAARFALVTATARSEPLRMKPATDGMLVNTTWIWPPTRSVIAGAAPRYGMCSIFTPAAALNISPSRWFTDPLPADPYDTDCFFASSASSPIVFTGRLGLTTATNGSVASVATAAKSFSGSNGRFEYSAPLIACVPT